MTTVGPLENNDPAARTSRVDEEGLPLLVSADLGMELCSYWLARAAQHTSDSYAGVRMSKFPEDLRVYEHLLWSSRANVVLELGAQFGGSALWFRDRLQSLAHYGRGSRGHVISIDINIEAAREGLAAADPDYADTITLVQGDVQDPALPDVVARLLPSGSRCFVVEDSAHIYETTWASLTGFAQFVPLGGYFVVEDGCVDVEEMRLDESWPRGVLPALKCWLATPDGAEFAVRRDLERYGLSCHPCGFLQRIAPARAQSS
jgi:cephalosporin hydroxylase